MCCVHSVCGEIKNHVEANPTSQGQGNQQGGGGVPASKRRKHPNGRHEENERDRPEKREGLSKNGNPGDGRHGCCLTPAMTGAAADV